MSAKEYLARYGNIKARLRSIEVLIDEIREELTNVGQVSLKSPLLDGQPHGTGVTDPTGNQAAKAADSMLEVYREKLRGQLRDLEVRELKARSQMWRQRVEIEETLGEVANPIYYDLLHRRYIECKSFEVISVELNYSYRHTTRLHGEALLDVEKVLKNAKK